MSIGFVIIQVWSLASRAVINYYLPVSYVDIGITGTMVVTTLPMTHRDCITHEPGRGHPEAPERLSAVLDIFKEPEFSGIVRESAPFGTEDDLARVHNRAFVSAVLVAAPISGHAALDADTILSPGSGAAALRAVGAIVAAVDAVVAGRANNAFCAVRPPGHHAEPAHAMGFCLFNSIAVWPPPRPTLWQIFTISSPRKVIGTRFPVATR